MAPARKPTPGLLNASGKTGIGAAALAGFAPVLDARTRTLILGSFPGVASLGAAQYYAHPRNQFWRLIGTVLNEDLVSLAYPERLNCLLSHGIGLWDVLAACHRDGSLDAAIRHARPNDFASLRAQAPQLATLGFNGKTAGRFAPLLAAAGYRTLVLPSSSPANAMLSFEQKLAAWRALPLG
ncbi:DNA-deoxyinosine glycosylase [Robbsia sp. Bb-Pol-6]|uniref:DNA-deoxyinosine glycosylase n=1 Tax=Robbsia betulipollinis TaxID=2981849 RepID=A0ABT3ZQU1_9BURK|nr:DNA-deoxyinosine glycosylase [Robbsia betulipollinis]MCY0388590.1 DNA-deoxyinosine glycosylase [Robbsia betulipollinis]